MVRSGRLAAFALSLISLMAAYGDTDRNDSIVAGTTSAQLEKLLRDAMVKLSEKAEKTSGFAQYEIMEDQVIGGKQVKPESKKISICGSNCLKVEFFEDDREFLEVINDVYAFMLVRPKDGNYAITAIQPRGANDDNDLRFRNRVSDARYLLLSSSDFYGRPIWDLVQDVGFRINRISAIQAEGGKIYIEVDFDYAPEHKSSKGVVGIENFTLKNARLVFDPSKDWNLVSYSRPAYPRTVTTIAGNSADQLPFTDVARQTDSKDGMVKSESVVRCVQSSYDAIPKSQFYLGHYGFPEPVFRKPSRWGWIGGGLIAGVICLVVSRRILRR